MTGSHKRSDKMKQVLAGECQGSETQTDLLLRCFPCTSCHVSMPDDTMCDSVLTVSLPTHYIHDKISLRTLLISATIVFIM